MTGTTWDLWHEWKVKPDTVWKPGTRGRIAQRLRIEPMTNDKKKVNVDFLWCSAVLVDQSLKQWSSKRFLFESYRRICRDVQSNIRWSLEGSRTPQKHDPHNQLIRASRSSQNWRITRESVWAFPRSSACKLWLFNLVFLWDSSLTLLTAFQIPLFLLGYLIQYWYGGLWLVVL